MTGKMFTESIRNAFILSGFKPSGGTLFFRGNVATVIIKSTKIPHADRHLIDVGFWLPEITKNMPLRPEKSQMYFRLDRIFPDRKHVILEGGDTTSSYQPQALAALSAEIVREIAPSLIELSNSYAALRIKFITDSGALGLITKEARILLSEKG